MNFWRKLLFNFWYWRRPPWDTRVSPPELQEFIRENSPGRALDLGCGTGTNVLTLSEAGWEAFGVDFAGTAIRKAKARAIASPGSPKFFVADVTKLDHFSRQFDLILDMGCFHSLAPSQYAAYAGNIGRLLSPGGTYMLYVFFRRSGKDSAGIWENDLSIFSKTLQTVKRTGGTNHGERKSAWLWMQAKSENRQVY